uniref:Uncharacterized protein n=1 Tax=Salvator merianae TaxID=96440 RepID=A0A8D0BCD3_SALMN
MASVREVSSFTEDLLCPICLSIFRDPHMLECGHSFCAPCLEPCIPKGQRRGLCPECRRPFALRRMAVNRALCSLAEKARLLKLDEGPGLGGSGGWYFCEEHEEPLKLFCSQDEGPVCVICRDLPQHRGHDFLVINYLPPHINVQESPRHQGEFWVSFFDCYLWRTAALENQREKNLAQMEAKLKELNWKVASWSETICQVRGGLECKDQISFLKVRERLGWGRLAVLRPLASSVPFSLCLVLRFKHAGLCFIVVTFYIFSLFSCITLDCNSAHPSLVLVEEATGVKYSPGRRFWRRKPERFISSPCVVGRKGFTSGRFYWEVRVGESTGWVVGAAKKSVKRKKRLNFRPKEGVWAIELKAEVYQALSEPRTLLSVCGRMDKVGIYLDYEGGQLSFYNSSSMNHLYTFQASFHEELLPFLSTQSSYPLSVWDLEL